MDNTISMAGWPPIEKVDLVRPLETPYGVEARIGLIALSTDLAIERDFARMLPDDRAALFTTRIHLETPNSDRTFLALQDDLVAATRLIIPDSRLDAVVFGCTAASTIIGPDRVAALVGQARPGVPVTNPATAATAALQALGARRLAVLTPYTRQMTGNVLRFLGDAGFHFASVRCLGFDTDVAIGSIPALAFLDLAQGKQLDGADALFISCTATKALDVIDAIEAAIGVPVITSNQAALWHALRLVGWKYPIPGFGALLREGFRS